MFEFGDELIIDSYRIPWLIWIQILAMLLLFIILYAFTSAPSDMCIPSDSPSSTALSFANRAFITSADANTRRQNEKVGENEIKETGTSTSEVVQRRKKPDDKPRAESSTTNEAGGKMYEHSHHPCHFFGIAKHAFLKCLGIDSTHEKHD